MQSGELLGSAMSGLVPSKWFGGMERRARKVERGLEEIDGKNAGQKVASLGKLAYMREDGEVFFSVKAGI